jgi:8-oxo-dGTP pyrophosphatase MutT (NUDIX family)
MCAARNISPSGWARNRDRAECVAGPRGGNGHSLSRLPIWNDEHFGQESHRNEFPALPFRRRVDTGRTEVMLVTSHRTGRWIIPKGWPMKQEAPHAASAREAREEAGVVGEVGTRPIGSYTYQKQLKQGAFVACKAHVFSLELKRQQRTWPESKRQVQWFSSADAAAAVQELALSEIIRTFQKLRSSG